MRSTLNERLYVLGISACLVLGGCGGSGSTGNASNSDEGARTTDQTITPKVSFETSTFVAQYYSENDGNDPGIGNDGSDTDIIPSFIAQDQVNGIAINYLADDLYGIDSYNFYGVWEGTLSVQQAGTVDINFDYSNADMTFNIDGSLEQRWSSDNKTLSVNLNEGDHAVKLELHNHFHLVHLNATFTSYPKLTVAMAGASIDPLISNDTKIVYIGTYESEDFQNNLTIQLPAYEGDVLLVISSYSAVNITIDNPNITKIAAVLLNSTQPLSYLKAPTDVLTYQITDLSWGYSNFDAPNADIASITGRTPDYEYGSYNLSSVMVPDF